MADELCLKMPDFHVTFGDLLHVVNLRRGTNGFTSLPKGGVLRIFSLWKIRRLRPGLNPRAWVPKANTVPLDHWSRCTVDVTIWLHGNLDYSVNYNMLVRDTESNTLLHFFHFLQYRVQHRYTHKLFSRWCYVLLNSHNFYTLFPHIYIVIININLQNNHISISPYSYTYLICAHPLSTIYTSTRCSSYQNLQQCTGTIL